MTSFEGLPREIVLAIARPATRRTIAALARANRRFYDTLNPLLYKLGCCKPTKSCILWGAQKGSLGTVTLGHQNGGDLNLNANDAEWPESGAVKTFSKDRWHYFTECGTALQLALRYGHQDIVAYLLDHGADVHAPSLACCHCRDLGRFSYPLHEVICNVPVGSAIGFYRDPERDKIAALMLIRHGAYLHAPDRPILHVLIERGWLDLIVPLLGQHGVDAGALDSMRRTPLRVAAECGRTDIAKILLGRPDVDDKALEGTLPAATEGAAKHGHIDTLRLLLNKAHTTFDRTITSNGPMCVGAFHAAAASGQLDIVRLLVEQFDVCPSERTTYGSAATHLAVTGGHVHVVEYLTGRSGSDVNVVDSSGMTALHYAAGATPGESAVPLIQVLVDAGANVNASASNNTYTNTPLQYAVERRRTGVALKLLSCGADPTVCGVDAQTGLTVLHRCMMPDRCPLPDQELELIKRLIDKGADATSSSTSAATGRQIRSHTDGPPLFFAAAYVKSDKCVRWLLEAGESPDVCLSNALALTVNAPQSLLVALFYYEFGDRYGVRGPLSTRIYLPDIRRVATRIRLLLKHGARMDSLASEQSALQYACEVAIEGCFELVCVLLRGATRSNISAEHLESLRVKYRSMSKESARIQPEDRRKIQRRSFVYQQLSDFANKAFMPQTIALSKAKAKARQVTRPAKTSRTGQ